MVAAGVLDEKTAQQAQTQAIRGKTPFVTYVVQNRLAKGRVIAELASSSSVLRCWILLRWTRNRCPRVW